MKPSEISTFFKSIRDGNIPPTLTCKELAGIKNADGISALDVAIECGHYPPGTTGKDLADEGKLYWAAWNGTLPKNTTIQHLENCKDEEELSTGLHAAAERGNLPAETKAQDLLGVLDCMDHTPLDELGAITAGPSNIPDQIPMVLENTTATHPAEIKQIGDILKAKNPVAVALWVAREMKKRSAQGCKS